MTEKSNASGIVILPVLLVGLIIGGTAFYPQRNAASPLAAPPLDSIQESRVVQQAIDQNLASLPNEPTELARAERHLMLRLNGNSERTLEVAGGLFAIAAKHLEHANSPEAMRVAQTCADLAPDSLLAARCWILCGDASAATYPDLPLSIRYYERADAALRKRLLDDPSQSVGLGWRAGLLLSLGQTKERFHRTDEAIRHLRELTETPALVAAQRPEDRLRAMLMLGRLLGPAGQQSEASQLLAAAHEYGLSDAVPAREALHVMVESVHDLSPDITDPARHAALQALWDSPRFANLPEWFRLGDELASAYFFHEPRLGADFEIVSRKFLSSVPSALESMPANCEERSELESLYATNLLLAADAARSRADEAEFARLVTLFESTFAGRDIQFTSPLNRPAQRMHRIGEIYRRTMTGHMEQLRQIQATGSGPARL